MKLADAQTRIIEEGIKGARRDYEAGQKLDGSIAGFDACRGKTSEQLAALLIEARADAERAHREEADDYWYWRCREAEVEWVCNVLSAIMVNEGWPPIVPPTVRGAMKAASIVGVADA